MEERYAQQSIEDRYRAAAANAYHELPSLGLGGASVPLTDVHVMLRSTRANERSRDIAGPDARPDRRSDPLLPRSDPPVPLGEALRAAPRMLLTGNAGAGKTTSLRFIALCFAKGSAQTELGLDEARLPVYLPLRDYAQQIADEGLVATVRADVKARLPAAEGALSTWWSEGRLALLLDGLDEVRDPHIRNRVISRVAEADLGANRIVVSTRPTAGVGVGNLSPYLLCPLDSREDRIAFLSGWIKAFSNLPSTEITVEATAVYEALSQREGLARLMESPLLLRMIAHIYVADFRHDVSRLETAVRTRAEIYGRYLRDVLPAYSHETGRSTAHPVGELLATARCIGYLVQSGQATTRDAITRALQRHRAMSPDDVREHLADLRERLGLLTYGPESDPGVAFAHLTFQEYLCADWLAQRWCEEPGRTWRFLRPRLHVPTWRETLLLLAGILASRCSLLGEELEPRRGNRFVWRVLWASSIYERFLRRDLVLVAHLLGEGPSEVVVRFAAPGWWVRKGLKRAAQSAWLEMRVRSLMRIARRRLQSIVALLQIESEQNDDFGDMIDTTLLSMLAAVQGAPHLLWEPALVGSVLDAADSLNDDADRARALGMLAPHLPESLMPRALGAAERIANDADRAVALRVLVPHLPESLMPQALDAAESIVGDVLKAWALGGLSATVSERLMSRALDAAHSLNDNADRAWALGALAPHLPEGRKAQALGLALDAAGSLKDDADRARVLGDLAPHLPESLMPRALDAAESIADALCRATALGDLVPHLPKDRKVPALGLALTAAESVADDLGRAGALSALAPHLPESLMPRALDAAESVANDLGRAWALGVLTPHLPKDLQARALRQAVEAAEAIADKRYRTLTLRRLAPLLSEVQAKEASTPDLLTHGWWFRNRQRVWRGLLVVLVYIAAFLGARFQWYAEQIAEGTLPVIDTWFILNMGIALVLGVMVPALWEALFGRGNRE